MKDNKKTRQGIIERKDVIKNVYKDCDKLVEEALAKFKRCDVAEDDIIDALIGAVTARFGLKPLKTIPDDPERDEISYRWKWYIACQNRTDFPFVNCHHSTISNI